MTSTYVYGLSDTLLEVILHEPSGARVPEALVQDIWLKQRFRRRGLTTFEGTSIDVLDPGRLNTDSGPDFMGARLRVGSTLWNGAVEIHVTSGAWQHHGHDRDPHYDSTVLHVVLYSDVWTGRLTRSDGSKLPEVVLLSYLEDPLRRLIRSFYTQPERSIPCGSGWPRVPNSVREPYVRELAHERMASKSRRFTAPGAEQALYEGILAGLGYSKNAASMRTLAHTVPLALLRTLGDERDVEALLLGAAGLLPAPADLLEADRQTADCVMELRDRFDRLNYRFGIASMPATAWKYFRLRPANFPPLRLAQAAALIGPSGLLHANPLDRLESAARSSRPVHALRRLFSVDLRTFWHVHVRLDRKARPHSATIGQQRVDALLVNAVLPALYATASEIKRAQLSSILDALPASSDEITRLFAELGTGASSATVAQGLHQLYRTRCSESRCLSCQIGRTLLNRSGTSS